MPPTGKVNPQHPEKKEHTKNLNDALSDALEKWNPGDGTEVVIKIEASVAPEPRRHQSVPGHPGAEVLIEA